MEISKTAIGAVAGLCIAAGAGGAYMANRSSLPAETTAIEAPLVSLDPSAPAVDESEAIVANDAALQPPIPAPSPAPAARRPEPARAATPRAREVRTTPSRSSAAVAGRHATDVNDDLRRPRSKHRRWNLRNRAPVEAEPAGTRVRGADRVGRFSRRACRSRRPSPANGRRLKTKFSRASRATSAWATAWRFPQVQRCMARSHS